MSQHSDLHSHSILSQIRSVWWSFSNCLWFSTHWRGCIRWWRHHSWLKWTWDTWTLPLNIWPRPCSSCPCCSRLGSSWDCTSVLSDTARWLCHMLISSAIICHFWNIPKPALHWHSNWRAWSYYFYFWTMAVLGNLLSCSFSFTLNITKYY